ncbi:MAG: nuclear transport factor 2 family protein [Candidatus Omnitrophica bacterium]|nr:nuclear transport factor 2 family protein [Candidatus Omnitrophota bacterium]
MTPETIQALLQDFFAAAGRKDIEAWVGCFAEDGVSHDPVGGIPTQGHANLHQFYGSIFESFDRIELTQDSTFLSGSGAAVKWTGTGRGKSGREVLFDGIYVFELNEDAKIQLLLAYWDPAEMLTELLQ